MQTQLQFYVNKDIVNVLIGEMLFDPSGDGEVAYSQERTLTAFTDLTASDKIQKSDGKLHTGRYGINIFNPVQFNLTVEYTYLVPRSVNKEGCLGRVSLLCFVWT